MVVTDKPVSPIESPSNSQKPSRPFLCTSPILSFVFCLRITVPEFPKRGVLFSPHPLKLGTIARLEKNLLQWSSALAPKRPIRHFMAKLEIEGKRGECGRSRSAILTFLMFGVVAYGGDWEGVLALSLKWLLCFWAVYLIFWIMVKSI